MKKFIFLLLFVVACSTVPQNIDTPIEGMMKFESRQEIIDFLDENQVSSYAPVFRSFGDDMMAVAESADAAPRASGASSYSKTNIQVQGVDEADFVKNDGQYIYMVKDNMLIIADAYPAEDAQIISEIDIDGYAQDIFINGDRLVVFARGDDEVYAFGQYEVIPRPVYKQMTHVLIYDVSDRDDPELEHDIQVQGGYVQSRMIGDHVYLVAQDPVYYHNTLIDMPVVREGSTMIQPDVYYFDVPSDNYNFNTVASVHIPSGDFDAESFLMGYANTLYVTENSMYVAYRKDNYLYGQEYQRERFFDAILPVLPGDIQDAILSIDRSDLSEAEKWDRISATLEEMYNRMDDDEKEDLFEEIEEASEEYDANMAEERSRSVIHKLSIDEGSISYEGRGEVPGYLLNQFSLDEHDGLLRVATTVDVWTRQSTVRYNNVYVLDGNLDIIGELEDIAEDESIYSTRFMGDRLYMVTFERVDPFFVIDLSNPREPTILGELKIPGFSDYLHPYDEDHIIGIGKETVDEEWGVTTQGVKVALFDVSDVTSPEMIDKYEIGKRGSDSEALRDHKAFLFDREKNLMVLPMFEVKDEDYERTWEERTWQGAYIFTVTDEGFDLRGKVEHESEENYRWNSGIRRALYMDDVLYTISNSAIQMNDIDTLDEINVLELPEQKSVIEPMGVDAGVERIIME